jgi:hypothetical protein
MWQGLAELTLLLCSRVREATLLLCSRVREAAVLLETFAHSLHDPACTIAVVYMGA